MNGLVTAIRPTYHGIGAYKYYVHDPYHFRVWDVFDLDRCVLATVVITDKKLLKSWFFMGYYVDTFCVRS